MINTLTPSNWAPQNKITEHGSRDNVPSFFGKVSNVFFDIVERKGFKYDYILQDHEVESFTNLIKSLVLGSEGAYKIFDIPVYFVEKKGRKEKNINCIFSSLYKKIFLINLHVFIHEMGHALAFKAFGKRAKAIIYSNATSGKAGTTFSHPSLKEVINSFICKQGSFKIGIFTLNKKQVDSIICAAGPLCNAIACSLEILIGTCLQKFNVVPIWATTAIKIVGLVNLSNELSYAINSFMNLDDGDFGLIAKNDNKHLLLASAFLIGISSLGLIGAEG